MEPWGVNQKSTNEVMEPLSQAEASFASPSESVRAKRVKVSYALLIACSLVLVAGGARHSWRESASLDMSGTTRVAGKSQIAKLADSLLKGTSLFRPSRGNPSSKLEPNQATRMSGAPLSLPLFFEANRGQTDAHVKFLARSSGYTLFVTPTETIFAGAKTTAPRGMFPTAKAAADDGPSPKMLRMKLLQSNPGPEVSGAKELPGKVNYLIGNNPRDWHTGIPLYEQVRSREVYPGIDLVFHGDQQQLEYDFQVAPGADPGRIRFKVSGAEKIAVEENGDLLLKAAKTEFRMRKPVIYQQVGERRQPVDGGFSLVADKLVAFHVGAYDKKIPLVIDPTIIFASFLGGGGAEVPSGQDLDVTNPSAPKLYVSGATTDITSFSETSANLAIAPGAAAYGFVAKIDPTTTGSASLDFLTFIGGSLVFTGGTAPCQNLATDMKLDVSGGAGQVEPVLLGQTNCRDFPVTTGGPTTGPDDLFITRLTPGGAGIDSSTLFGGNGSEGLTFGGGASLFVNPEGKIVLSGQTTSTDFPATSNAYSVSLNNGTPGGFDDCFIANLDRSFNVLYLTYANVGGSTKSGTPASCGVGAVDPAGKIYFGGTIVSATAFNLTNGNTGANGFQKTFVGTPGTTPNAFVAVLDPSQSGLSQLTYSTYIAGGGGTVIRAGAVDVVHGMAVVVGDTISNNTTNAPDIPLLNAIQSVNNSPTGVGTGWITVIDTTKTGMPSLAASTYFGGSTGAGSTSLRSVAIDAVAGNPPTQRIVVGGQTTATNFPTMNPLQASLVGGQNAVVSVLSVPSSGFTFNMSLLFSTYLGGGVTISGQSESVRGLIADSNHQIYALGRTASANFFGNTSPATTVNGFQTACASCGGGTPADDLAIFVLTPQSGTSVPDLTVTKSHSGSFSQGQSGAQFSITVTNSGTGATVGTVSLVDSLPSSLTATAMTGTGWSCSISTLVCTRSDALAGGASYPVITLTVNVAGNAPPTVTNTVVVSGGSETNTANDTATDVATIKSSVGACTDNYIGLTNGSWGTATNWSLGAVPGINDVACSPSGITVLIDTGLAAANQTIKALNSSGTLTISAGPLTISNNSVANVVNISSGTLTVNGQFSVTGALGLTGGTFGGTGEFDLEGLFTWSGGTMTGAGTTNTRGGMSIPNATVVLDTRTLNASGTTTFGDPAKGGSILYLQNGAMVNNLSGAIWNIVNGSASFGNGIANNGGVAPAFNNAGTFEMTGGTSDTIGVAFNNTGSVMGNSGTLNFIGGGKCGTICSGTYTAGTGATIAFSAGTYVQSGPINGPGTVNFNGATMDFGSGIETISSVTTIFSSGTITDTGSINFTTLLTWTGGSWAGTGTTNTETGLSIPNAAVVLDTRTLNASGTTTFGDPAKGGSILYLQNGAVLNNLSGAIWNIVNGSASFGNGIANNGGVAPAFNNAGTFEMTGGASETIGVAFNNTGSVMGNSGTLNFTGGGKCGTICSGTYTAGTGATIAFSAGTFVQSGPINGPGTVNFNGATMNFGSGTETISSVTTIFSSGTITNTGNINFTTLLTWTGGSWTGTGTTNTQGGLSIPNAAVVLDTRTLNASGTTTFGDVIKGGSTLYLQNGAVLNNLSGATWNIVNGSASFGNGIANNGGLTPVFNNAGTFEMTGGTSDTIGVAFANAGTVAANAATLSFAGGGTGAGSWTVSTGASLQFSAGTFALTGPIGGSTAAQGGGTVNFNGGTVNYTGSSYNIAGGTMGSGGTANFTAPGVVTNAGAVTITGGTLNFSTTPTGQLTPNAIATTAMAIGNGILGGTDTVNISGLLTWTSGGFMCLVPNCSAPGTGVPNSVTNANGGIAGSTGYLYLLGRTLNNAGTATFSNPNGTYFYEGYGAIVNNKTGATWNLTTDYNIAIYSGTATFNNAGTFEKTAGTTSSAVGVTFTNTGAVADNVATLNFSGGGTGAGAWTVSTGAMLEFSGGTFALTGPIGGSTATQGGGTVNFNGGTVNYTGSSYNIAGGTMASGGTANFTAPGVVTNAGPVTITGGTLNFSTGNAIAMTTLALGNGTLGGTDTVNISGLLTWTSGGFMCLLPDCSAPGTGVPNGVTNANGGIAGSTGYLYLLGRTLNNAGTATFSNPNGTSFYEGYGAIVNNKTGATWNLTTDYNIGIYSGTATFNNAGTFEKTAGTTSSAVGVTFTNTGAVADNVATLNFSGGGTGAGAWTVSTGAMLEFSGGTFALTGPIGGSTATQGGGTVNFNGGTVNYTGSSYNIAGGTMASGGTANFTAPGVVTNAGPVTITGGTLNFSTGNAIAMTTLALGNGTLGGTDTVNISGLLTWTSGGFMCLLPDCSAPGTGVPNGVTNANGGIAGSTGYLYLLGRTLNNAGTATFSNPNGTSFYEGYGAIVNNKTGATWNLTTDYNIGIYSGTATFNNAGTFEKTAGTTSSAVGVTFNNAGSVLADADTLSFQGAYTQTAGNTFLGGGSIQTVNPLNIQGGAVTGSGTITSFGSPAGISNVGGTLSPGVSTPVVTAGTISIGTSTAGNYTQSSAGAFNVKIGGTGAGQFDSVTLTGTATLAGALNVSLINPFSPALGNTFTILTASAVSGTFSSTNLPGLSAGLGWKVTYTATTVVLSVVTVSSPVANLNPGSVPFPNTIVNTAATIQKVQLQNTGTAPLIITSIQPTGADAANYSYTVDATQPCPISPATLGISASCMLDIGFLPLTAGTHNNAQITVTDNSGNIVGSTQTVALSGTGIVLSSIAVTPSAPTIPQGTSEQFTATGTYSDSSTQNLTTQVTWASATASVSTINAGGLAQGLTPGTSNITAKQGAVTSPAALLTVTGATHFAVSAPGSVIAGTAFNVSVFAADQFNNVVPGYTGTVHFTSTDGAAVLPANTTLTNGSGLFQVTLKTLGSQTVTATDTVTASITGTSQAITVGSGLATHFQVSMPGSATVGTATSVTVTALDQFNNVASGYTGTVHFTSSDGSAVLPANSTLTSGSGTFPVTFKSVGSQTVTATDTATLSITGTSNSVTVGTGAATHFLVTAPGAATAGTPFNVSVTALDQFNNVVKSYAGTVHFTSTDGQATLPANTTLVSGTGIFPVTLKTAGTQSVTATDTVTPAITGTSGAINVTVVLQTITVAPTSASVSAGLTQPFTATGHFSDGTTGAVSVNWTSSDNTIATINASGVATGVKAGGPVTITATSTANAAISGTAQLTVTAATLQTITVAPTSASVSTGLTQPFTATGHFSDGTTGAVSVNWTSSDNTIATINTSGVATGVKAGGPVTITATSTANAAISGTAQLTVTAATLQTITVAPASTSVAAGLTQPFTATGHFSDGTSGVVSVSWTSSNTTIATINAGGVATGVKAGGPVTITATSTANAAISGTAQLTVTAATLQTITVAPTSASVTAGLTQPFTATGHFSDGTTGAVSVNWTSSDNTIATINASGVATGVKAGGPVTITATSTTNAAISGTAQLTVTAATLQTITVAPTSASVTAGLTQPFTATGHFSDGTTGAVSVNWTSSDNTIATINTSGVATGVKAGGPVTITATSTANAAISGTAQLTVTAATLQTITVAPASTSVAAGLTQPFTATGHFSDGTTGAVSVNWTSSNTAIATINASGVATGVKAGGPVTITATSTANAAISGTAQLTVTAAVLQTITVAPTSASVSTGLTQPFTATGHFSDGTTGAVSVNWTSSDNTIATINASGVATGVKAGGPVTITATSTANAAISGTAQLTVTAATLQTITVAPASTSVAAGLTQPFTATGHFSDGTTGAVGVNWTSSNTAIATINASGVATGVKAGGPVTITATSTANAAISGTAQLTVTAATLQTITVAPTSASVSTGLTQPFTATGHFSDGTTGAVSVNWASSDNTIATINASGVATGVKAGGPVTITATSTTNAAISGTAQLTVTAATLQTITVAPTSASVSTGLTQPFTATGHFSDGTTGAVSVNWTSSDNTIATINTSGVATGVKAGGPVTITATSTANAAISGTAQLTVTAATLQTITVAPTSASVSAGLTQPFTATGHFSDGTTGAVSVNWTSSDNTIATINASGVATGVKAGGPVTITATSTANAAISGTAQLTVTAAVLQTITVAPTSASVTAGLTQPFTATGHFSDGTTGAVSVNWTSSNTGFATINASGVATGVTAGGPITITATSGNIFGTAQLTVTPVVVTNFPLNVTLIGTGTGSVTDKLGSIDCVNTAGVITGTCTANYPMGTVVTLTSSPTAPSTFGGWLQACTGTGGCSVTMNSAQSVTASFVPAPKMIPVPFTPGSNASGMATYDCPSNPNPSPGNPCLDPNAHATSLTIGQVLTPFTLTVVATEVPPTNGNGICENGLTAAQDLDCRFKSFFTFQTKPNGDTVVPLCDPYANGNCVVYSVFFQTPGKEPDPSMYVGPVNWNITFNNDTFVPPAPWTGSTPRVYYDPSGFFMPNSPYGTDCTTPMLIGNPGVPTNPAIFCQFVFDITTMYDPTKKVDALMGAKTKVFSDVVVAFPPIFAPVVTVATTPDAATVTAGSPIGFTIAVSNSAAATANNVSLNTPLPGGTNVNWTISPYAGPGTCAITGAIGSQVLNCAFGTLSPSTNLSVHIQSASSAAGTAISPSTVLVGTQQLLSIGSIVVQPITVTFSGLTTSESVPAGTSSILLGGVIGNGTQFAPSGETVSISINGVTLPTTVGSNGVFSLQFPTAGIPASATPYPITYSYAGDSLLSTATNNSTTLTVVSPPAGVNLSTTLQSATTDVSGNYVFTVRITNSGATTATAAAIKTAVLTTVVGTTRVATASTTTLPLNLGNIASLSSVTATLTFPASAGPPNAAGAISLGFGFTGGSASATLKATLP